MEIFLCAPCVILFVVSSMYLLRLFADVRRDLPPGPWPLPLIGNLLDLGAQPHRSLARLAERHGPLMTLRLGAVTTIVASSADAARDVLQRHDAAFSARSVPDAARACAHDMFSVGWLPPSSPQWRALRKIERRVLERDAREPPKNDFLDVLLDYRSPEDGRGFGRQTLRSLLTDLFSAGTDTSSGTVEWAMAELLQNPPSMAKAREELAQVIGSKSEIEESDIGQLKYLQAIVKEVFRLHPPAPFLLPRQAVATTELGGYTVPKGARVLVNVWAIGRDRKLWTEPEKFMPERFMGKEIDYRGRDFELLPFGSGRRICPGMPLAVRMVHLMLATLLYRFEWRLPREVEGNGVDMGEKFGMILGLATPLHAIAEPI
ncbi:unnamed protein product [Alopecurus aequalis]